MFKASNYETSKQAEENIFKLNVFLIIIGVPTSVWNYDSFLTWLREWAHLFTYSQIKGYKSGQLNFGSDNYSSLHIYL